MRYTDQVRDAISKVLKNNPTGLTFNQLFEELKKISELKLVDKNGEDRVGVLRGITYRLDSKPIENVIVEKRIEQRGEKRVSINYYVYVSNELNQLEVIIKNFLQEVKEQKLLNVSVLDFNKDDREKFKEYETLITRLHDLIINIEND